MMEQEDSLDAFCCAGRTRSAKVPNVSADISGMESPHTPDLPPQDPRWHEARSLELSVAAIRKARGKLNPEDCTIGTPEHDAVSVDFLRDLLDAMDVKSEAARRRSSAQQKT